MTIGWVIVCGGTGFILGCLVCLTVLRAVHPA